MNKQVLQKAEKSFLKAHPQGFESPEMQEMLKKHKIEQMNDMIKRDFGKQSFDDPATVIENAIKFMGKSSLVSMFEKPKYRDAMKALSKREQESFSDGLYNMLHGKQQQGFEAKLEVLGKKKLAKWTLLTVIPSYNKPKRDLLIKPSTTKLIIEKLELDVEYKPQPTWNFYSKYRKHINAMRRLVEPTIAPSNTAFCGFLMSEL